MILSYDKFWAKYLEDIDIKSYEWPWTGDFWAGEVKKYSVKIWMEESSEPLVVKSCEKTPHGFVVYRFINVRDLMDIEKDIKDTIIYIEKLAVHPDWRNKGVGKKLLESVESAAKLQSVSVLVIFLHEENDVGRKWLLKHGFEVCKLHPKQFPDGRDAYSFMKVIS